MENAARFAMILLVVVATVGCADDAEETACGGSDCFGTWLEVTPNPISFGEVEMGASETIEVTLSNLGTKPYRIESVRLAEDTLDDPGGSEFSRGDEWFESALLGPDETRTLEVVYQPTDRLSDSGKVLLELGGSGEASGIYELAIRSSVFGPDISTTDSVVFERVAPVSGDTTGDTAGDAFGAFSTQEVRNEGNAPLHFDSVILTESRNFTVEFFVENPGDVPAEGSSQWPATLQPGEAFWYRVYFTPDDRQVASANLFFLTNDPDERAFQVELVGNPNAPCLDLSPAGLSEADVSPSDVSQVTGVDFGPSGIGFAHTTTLTIRNCSRTVDLEIGSIEVTDDPNDVFAIVDRTLPDALRNGMPHTLGPEEQLNFVVTFTPLDASESTGDLTIASDDIVTPNVVVPLVGRGADNQCPVAIARATTGGGQPAVELVVPVNSAVRLDGSLSFDPDGSVTQYEWSLVQQPAGSQGVRLLPGADVPNPVVSTDAPGVYVIDLTVFDNGGLASCETARVRFEVVDP